MKQASLAFPQIFRQSVVFRQVIEIVLRTLFDHLRPLGGLAGCQYAYPKVKSKRADALKAVEYGEGPKAQQRLWGYFRASARHLANLRNRETGRTVRTRDIWHFEGEPLRK